MAEEQNAKRREYNAQAQGASSGVSLAVSEAERTRVTTQVRILHEEVSGGRRDEGLVARHASEVLRKDAVEAFMSRRDECWPDDAFKVRVTNMKHVDRALRASTPTESRAQCSPTPRPDNPRIELNYLLSSRRSNYWYLAGT